jgi:DNA primase
MFDTKNLIYDYKNVPETWIFEYFCKLNVKLSGQDIKIKSVFNPSERTPSFTIFCKNGKYFFKDFSTGIGGTPIYFVMRYFSKTFSEAANYVVKEYCEYIVTNKEYVISDIVPSFKYVVKEYKKRQWNVDDAKFWTQFNIDSKMLGLHNVFPLEYYVMEKENAFRVNSLYSYGYFKNDGSLYKIYSPKNPEQKFIKVCSYIQGIEQIEHNKNLLIASSLKDIMATKSLKLKNIDVIAPDSENTIIKLEEYFKQYENIVVMLDVDDAGINAMKKYKSLYPQCEILPLFLSKDISDSIRDYSPEYVFKILVPLLDKKLSLHNEKERENTML